MFRKKQHYKTTKQIQLIYIKISAYSDLRDRYIDENRHVRAVQCAIEKEKLRTKMWEIIFDLYPELKGKQMRYDPYCNHVTIVD